MDITILSAMGPPGGGRTFVTPRMLRHFITIAYTELNDETIKSIYCQICAAFLKAASKDIRDLIEITVSSTVKIYNEISIKLKPTPSKSHYTFNLRDISKVFQGVCNVNL
jgi:dynein heavy chain